jgi:hypothetical protein
MGSVLYGIDLAVYGKPKPILQDDWDRMIAKRDERVLGAPATQAATKVSSS